MADEDKPNEYPIQPGALDKIKEVIGEINLPKLIAGPAGDAISRLIAGGADIPAAWLEQKAKAIRDKTAAQTQIANALAGAASELVKNDPALVQRAADAFISKELRHQHNRETIAVKAIEHLREEPDAATSKLDDDWLNMFARHAQEASSDRMHSLWSQILAGQLRRPQAFSLQTLRFVSELDEQTAALFEKWSPRVANSRTIPYPEKSGQEFQELLHLEDCGLISGVAGQLSNQIKDENVIEHGNQIVPVIVRFRPHILIIDVRKPFNASYPVVMLTRVGRELYPITKGQSTSESAQAFADKFPKHNVRRISAFVSGTEPTAIWEEDEPPSG